jgi:hypothetical protein
VALIQSHVEKTFKLNSIYIFLDGDDGNNNDNSNNNNSNNNSNNNNNNFKRYLIYNNTNNLFENYLKHDNITNSMNTDFNLKYNTKYNTNNFDRKGDEIVDIAKFLNNLSTIAIYCNQYHQDIWPGFFSDYLHTYI